MTSADLRSALSDEAMRWLGTPYHHMGDVMGPGGGVDCLMLLVRVFASVGCIPADFDPRPYAPQWHLHRDEERYLMGLERYAHLLPAGQGLGVGDIVAWRFGRTFSHAGLIVRPHPSGPLEVVHALVDAHEVTMQRLDSAPLESRPWRAYTLFPEQA